MKMTGAATIFLSARRWVSTAFAQGRGGVTNPDKPNIVYILADDMGYGDLACQNPQTKIPTPNLDRLAARGIRFTDAHSPSAVCTPTRYGILTGRYCWRSRLKRGVLSPWGRTLIEEGRLTVPTMLKTHGYHTACIQGSYGHGIDFSKPVASGPTTRGFDYYFGTSVPNYPPYCFMENDRTVGIPDRPKPESMFGHKGPMVEGWKLERILPELARKAVAYIDNAGKGEPPTPFFLYFPLTAPHTPIEPAARFRGKSKAGPYGDFVHQVDWTVGQIMDAVKRNGFEENILIVFTSDNGSPARDGLCGSTGPVGSVLKFGHDPNRPWRGRKGDAWDGGHREPFVARWPGRIAPGTISDEPICQVDLMATCAAILGAKLPENAGEDSYNILPALEGRKMSKPIREAIVHHSADGLFAVRQGKWKLILGLGSGSGFSKPRRVEPKPGGPRGQLYDLHADPGESKNLWLEQQDVVERLTALLEKYRKEGRSAPRL
ncbi:hypothetical protein AMJ85_03080 [candidate division BRC1 bacterium SM23_51]|nr:MAG: hypothetical protein AMJ85_03080 [candidate division BRC1 bacterium SM23_51]